MSEKTGELIRIFTDGGCLGNPGPGGWAAVILRGEREIVLSGREKETTNNRMELTAAISALEKIEKDGLGSRPLELCTDSTYMKKGATEWVKKWRVSGWKTGKKEPVKNRDLWERLDHLNTALKPEWIWVKGHAGHQYNEMCDLIVKNEMEKLR